jgi:coenzyme F420-0:L-glutamate ligase/coenzyme F420-1:gamma-L-glutamate ligase
MTIAIVPVHGIPEVHPGDDLPGLLADAIRLQGGLSAGDIVVVTQKVVSKAEGRVVPEGPDGRGAWVDRETARIVAKRGDLTIARTRHGFVCANAGVDASNVGEGMLTLLPEDPDGSAARLRAALEGAFGVRAGVVITDTFGRPWRAGLVNVAIGCAGLPALVDLRGTPDATGRPLEVTIVALADEIAAASGLVMGKADGIPAAVVRGVAVDAEPRPASALVRPLEEDLFSEAPLTAVAATGSERAGANDGDPSGSFVPAVALRDAVAAARGSLGRDAVRVEITPVAPSGDDSGVTLVEVSCLAGDDEGELLAGAAAQACRIALHALGIDSSLAPARPVSDAGGEGSTRPVALIHVREAATA